jgi:hypothetical protein
MFKETLNQLIVVLFEQGCEDRRRSQFSALGLIS